MTHTCHECSFFEPGDVDPDAGRLGKCALARKKYGGDVKKSWSAPACKGFEKKDKGHRRGRRR